MKNIHKVVFVALSLVFLLSSRSDASERIEAEVEVEVTTTEAEVRSFAEHKLVVAALQPYIDAAKTGDGDSLRAVFFDHAYVVGSTHGNFQSVDADSFRDAVDGAESPDVQHHIAWIDISGPAAAAKVEFVHWGGFRFTDFFVLYKHDGEWKISGKVYDSHAQN